MFSESDVVYHSENIYRSQDIRRSKNILFSDGIQNCEYLVAASVMVTAHSVFG